MFGVHGLTSKLVTVVQTDRPEVSSSFPSPQFLAIILSVLFATYILAGDTSNF
jgi:hypothetical protein